MDRKIYGLFLDGPISDDHGEWLDYECIGDESKNMLLHKILMAPKITAAVTDSFYSIDLHWFRLEER